MGVRRQHLYTTDHHRLPTQHDTAIANAQFKDTAWRAGLVSGESFLPRFDCKGAVRGAGHRVFKASTT